MKKRTRFAAKVLCMLILLPLFTSCGENRYGLDLSQFQGGAMRNENMQWGDVPIAASDGYYYYFRILKGPTGDRYEQLYEYSIKDKTTLPVKGIHSAKFLGPGTQLNYIREFHSLQAAGKYLIMSYEANDIIHKKGVMLPAVRSYCPICVCLRDGSSLKILKTIKTAYTPAKAGEYKTKPPLSTISYFKGSLYYLKYSSGGPLCALNLHTGKVTQLASNVAQYHIADGTVYFMDGKYNIWRVNGKDEKEEIIKGKGDAEDFSLYGTKLYYLVYYFTKDKNNVLRQEIHCADANGKNDQIIFRKNCKKRAFISLVALNNRRLVTCDKSQNSILGKLAEIDRNSSGKWVETNKDFGPYKLRDYYASGENIIAHWYRKHTDMGLYIISPDGKQMHLPYSDITYR